jgi:glutathione reductase (NADPH)
MAKRYDIVIIGGGNAGFGVSSVAAEVGKRIAFVEERDFGGTCPNRGCTPKKVLVAAAHALHEIEAAKTHCIAVGEPRLDWAKLIDREKAMIAPIPGRLEALAAKRGDVVRGRARFVGPKAVAVGDTVLEADHIVIATGSKPRPLSIRGAEHLITSEDVLNERELPREVVFIGGGVIAMEFSHVYARAGAKVTILEALPRVLPGLDADAVAEIRKESERIGIAINTGVKVSEIARVGDKLRVSFVHEGREAKIDADRIVNGTGRVANVDSLDLDTGGVRHDGVRVEVDSYLRSVSNPAVWVCGDAVVASAQLSPLATYEGQIVGRNIVNGASEKPDYRAIPSCVYTVPALASVGLTESEAKAKGLKVAVSINDMSDWLSSRTYGETAAWAKVLVEEGTGRIVGAHIVGHSGEELIHLFALAMRHGITAAEVKSAVFAFPTYSADIKSLV